MANVLNYDCTGFEIGFSTWPPHINGNFYAPMEAS